MQLNHNQIKQGNFSSIIAVVNAPDFPTAQQAWDKLAAMPREEWVGGYELPNGWEIAWEPEDCNGWLQTGMYAMSPCGFLLRPEEGYTVTKGGVEEYRMGGWGQVDKPGGTGDPWANGDLLATINFHAFK